MTAPRRTDHVWLQIGTHDQEGYRTHAPPGDVCAACSDPDAGRWVPISQCGQAMADYERNRAHLGMDL